MSYGQDYDNNTFYPDNAEKNHGGKPKESKGNGYTYYEYPDGTTIGVPDGTKIGTTPSPSTGSTGSYTGGSSYKPPKPTNKPPTISGEDKDLGAQNQAFYYEYKIDDPDSAEVRVDISLNQKVIETIQNVQRNAVLKLEITEELMQGLKIGEKNYIVITATDNKNAKAYRNLTFTKVNAPPEITVDTTAKDLSKVDETFDIRYVAVDREGDAMTGIVLLDGIPMQEEAVSIASGVQEVFKIPHVTFLKIAPGEHTITVKVTDDKGMASQKDIKFMRIADEIVVRLDPVVLTSVMAERIQCALTMMKGGDRVTVKVEATNNANDDNPAWEDITEIIETGKIYSFVNKTANKESAINLRFTIKSNGTQKETVFKGFGGAFE